MLKINKITSDTTVDFAAEELKKYLRMMMPEGGDVKIAYAPEAKDGFRLGLMQDFSLDVSDAEDTALDDVLYIKCDTGGGIIAGSNKRSVLLAVYEYLRQNGCRWLFPGVDGEFIPMQDIRPVKYRHKADSRIRGNCIEGYTSQPMLLEFIEFMPKVGLNTFMIQFRVPSTFYSRFYEHSDNRQNFSPEPVSTSQVVQWTIELECEIAKRGIFLHSYGHGFTTDPFGIDSAIGWDEVKASDYPEEIMKNYALLGGKRGFFNNQPLNTQICMSNRDARKRICDYVTSYAESHSNIDYLHIWLADSYNNHCECEECKKHIPSDHYVTLLNEIDDALCEKGLETLLVCIVFVDTFWAPITERLHKNGRFTLMFAPITRDYAKDYDKSQPLPSIRPYERNKLKMPCSFEENLAYYNEWIKIFDSDRFVFEYHFCMHHRYDLCGRMLARRIIKDIEAYRSIGEQGIIECGTQRAFFPNGFAFYTHARALFDASLTLDSIEKDYYRTAYGDICDGVAGILEKITNEVPYEYVSAMHAEVRKEKYATPDAKERIERARVYGKELLALVRENYNSDVRVRTVSVRLLEYFCLYLDKMLDVLQMLAQNDKPGAEAALRTLEKVVGADELTHETCFDFGQAIRYINNYIIKAV